MKHLPVMSLFAQLATIVQYRLPVNSVTITEASHHQVRNCPLRLYPAVPGGLPCARITDLLELDEAALPEKLARIVRATRTGVPAHDVEGVGRAIEAWGYPRAWLDLETIAIAISRWIWARPYERVPFQFSIHIEEAHGNISHKDSLGLDGANPRRFCAEALIKAIPEKATIVAYNASFEKWVLYELASQFPDLKPALLDMVRESSIYSQWQRHAGIIGISVLNWPPFRPDTWA